MKSIKIILLTIIILPFIFCSCSKDEPTGSYQEKPNVFVYGLLGVRPDWANPDSNYFWVYSRVFNNPDYQNVEAELSHGTTIIPLQSDYWDSDKYFTEGRSNFSFKPNEKYGFRMWDSKNTYSGTITTLPPMEITIDTVIANQIILEWTDINADFYDIEFLNYGNFEKHFQVEDNQFTLNISELPLGSASDVYISIAGFKGFSPISNPIGNVEGCYGYLFGFSMNETNLDFQTMRFSKQISNSSPPNLDKLILSFFKYNSALDESTYATDIKFKFTYGSINNSSYSQSGWSDFNSVTIVEPANSINIIEGYINDIQLESSNWSGFYYSLSSWDNIYETYDKNVRFKFRLNINNQLDSAFVANPDTFSILSYPPTYIIPVAPFEISWRRPDNADFFFVDASWEVKGDSLYKNYFYITNNNSYNFSDIPDSVVLGQIGVAAINGANPMRTLEPNLKRLNGYFYSIRSCSNYLTFSGNNLKRGLNNYSTKENTLELNKKIDHFIISKLSKKYPKLQNHSLKLLNQINKE
jgi:hypothetical protein